MTLGQRPPHSGVKWGHCTEFRRRWDYPQDQGTRPATVTAAERLFQEALDKFGTIDVVAHCAGIMPLGYIADGDLEWLSVEGITERLSAGRNTVAMERRPLALRPHGP